MKQLRILFPTTIAWEKIYVGRRVMNQQISPLSSRPLKMMLPLLTKTDHSIHIWIVIAHSYFVLFYFI